MSQSYLTIRSPGRSACLQVSQNTAVRAIQTLAVRADQQKAKHETSSPLQAVPLPALLRSLLVLTVAALPPRAVSSLARVARKHANTIESFGVLRALVRRTFYKHFCVGATKDETSATISDLRKLGINGVVLAFAREAESGSKSIGRLTSTDTGLREWTKMNIETLEKLEKGDFLALRLSGAGAPAVEFMRRFTQICEHSSERDAAAELSESLRAFQQSLHDVCKAAQDREVRVLVDAEGSPLQRAIDYFALRLMREFNVHGFALVFNTYQMYLKSNLSKILDHLQHSVDNNYQSGMKLVRGAYLHVDKNRHLIHGSKSETDEAFDNAVAHLLRGDRAQTVAQSDSAVHHSGASDRSLSWRADLMLATHNTRSVDRALTRFEALQVEGSSSSNTHGVQHLFFAQLMGMADEISLDLVKRTASFKSNDGTGYPKVGVYKYSVWGSLSECLLYMLRRAEENRDAVVRSRETAAATLRELFRRMRYWQKQ